MSGAPGLPVERIVERLSLAVSLTDEFTGAAAVAGRMAVAIRELDAQALKNRSGYYLFTNIPEGSYTVAAGSDYYFPALQSVGVPDPASPPVIVDITLKPGPTYPFPPGATLLRGGVRLASGGASGGTSGSALPGAGVEATALNADSGSKASLARAAAKGDASVSLVNIAGGIAVGDLLLIRDADRWRQEFIKIAAPLPWNPRLQPFNLAAGVQFNHAAGTELRQLVAGGSALNTTTDERGEFVVYFSQVQADRFMARVKVSHEHYTDVVKEVEVARGEASSLGLIRLSV